jgi:hypothetical protein
VEVLIAFVSVHRLLHGSCDILPEGHLPYAGSVMACMRISLIELVLWSALRWVHAPVYMLWSMRALAFVR